MDDIAALRVLLADTDSSEFTNDQLQSFFDSAAQVESRIAGTTITGNGDLILAAALATQALVIRYAKIKAQQVSIGGFEASTGRNQVRMLEQQADRYMELYQEQPAFAIARGTRCTLDHLLFIRSYCCRLDC